MYACKTRKKEYNETISVTLTEIRETKLGEYYLLLSFLPRDNRFVMSPARFPDGKLTSSDVIFGVRSVT